MCEVRYSLPDLYYLSSVLDTRQKSFCTRQRLYRVLHLAKKHLANILSVKCSFLSAFLYSTKKYTRQQVNYKSMKKLYIFCRWLPIHIFHHFLQILSYGNWTRNLSLVHKLVYYCTPISIMFVLCFSSTNINKTKCKMTVWVTKLIQMKSLWTTKLHNFLRSTTFIMIVFSFEIVYKLWISNSRASTVFLYDSMVSNQKVLNYKVS